MHNDLAWAVLGVDPATRELVEGSAKQNGVSIGRWLELMIAKSRSVAAEQASLEASLRKRDQQLRDLIADMADSLMDAAGLLNKAPPEKAQGAPDSKPEFPKASSAADTDEHSSEIEKIQAWMQRRNDKTAPPVPERARRGFLRRSA